MLPQPCLPMLEPAPAVADWTVSGPGTATPKPMVARRAALRQVMDRFPDATVARIRQTYAGTGRTPGGYLRTLLTQTLGGAPARPSATTLHDDFRLLGFVQSR